MDIWDLDDALRGLFQKDGVKLYVKELQKARLLVSHLNINLKSIHLLDYAPALSDLRKMFPALVECAYHNRPGKRQMLCAVKNAHALLQYIKNQ